MAARYLLFMHKTVQQLESELFALESNIRKLREKGLLQSAGTDGHSISKHHLQLKDLNDELSAILEALHRKDPARYPDSPYSSSVTHVVFGD